MEHRMEDLEIRLALLERGLEQLNSVMQELSMQVTRIAREVVELREELRGGGGALTVSSDPMDEVPPHY